MPPPLQPQTPMRSGSTQGWAFSQRTPARRSPSSPSLHSRLATEVSCARLAAVALRLSMLATT